jgi:hypothetical protein
MLFFFFCSTEEWIQGFEHAKQTPSPFVVIFIGVAFDLGSY